MIKMTPEEYQKKYGQYPQTFDGVGGVAKNVPDAKATRGFAIGLATGAFKAVGETAMGVGQMGRKVQEGISSVTGLPITDKGTNPFDEARAGEFEEKFKATEKGESAGKFLGILAQYMVPTGAIVRGQKMLSSVSKTLTSKLPQSISKGADIIGQGLSRFVPEAVGTGSVSFARSGGDVEQAKDEGVLAGLFSTALGAAGSALRSTYYPELKSSVAKALGFQGKQSGGVALGNLDKKVDGMAVLANKGKDVMVKTADGMEEAFNPKSATYSTTLQAWNKTRKSIYDEYTSLATSVGDDVTVDISKAIEALNDIAQAPRLGVYKNTANSLADDIKRNFGDATQVNAKELQQFIEDLNSQTVNSFFKGTSDAVSSEVNASTARILREQLDDLLSKNTGEQYQLLRNQYGALKSIEDDLVRKFQQASRKVGGGLPEYVGMFASGDIIAGILSGNVSGVARGAGLGVLAKLKRQLSDPERFLKRSFELVEEGDKRGVISERFFGASKTSQQVPIGQ